MPLVLERTSLSFVLNLTQLYYNARHFGHASSLVSNLSCVGGDERAWYTLFAHAQLPQEFWEVENFHKSCSITLAYRGTLTSPVYKMMPATDHTLCGRWSYVGSQLFACRNCPHVHPFQINTVDMTDAIFTFEFHQLPRTKQHRPLPSKQYCFWQNHL